MIAKTTFTLFPSGGEKGAEANPLNNPFLFGNLNYSA
jgi:hypothetical protein